MKLILLLQFLQIILKQLTLITKRNILLLLIFPALLVFFIIFFNRVFHPLFSFFWKNFLIFNYPVTTNMEKIIGLHHGIMWFIITIIILVLWLIINFFISYIYSNKEILILFDVAGLISNKYEKNFLNNFEKTVPNFLGFVYVNKINKLKINKIRYTLRGRFFRFTLPCYVTCEMSVNFHLKKNDFFLNETNLNELKGYSLYFEDYFKNLPFHFFSNSDFGEFGEVIKNIAKKMKLRFFTYLEVKKQTTKIKINYNNYVDSLLNLSLILTKRILLNRNFTEQKYLESAWTLIPCFILINIAIPSFNILYLNEEIINPDLTVNIIAHQWYWSLDLKDLHFGFIMKNNTNNTFKLYENNLDKFIFDSYMEPEDYLNKKAGDFRLLETEEPFILPSKVNLRLIISSFDTLHSFTIPSIGLKIDAVPGRLNELGCLLKNSGVFYGQCSEICGIGHAFMPITLYSVPRLNFLLGTSIY